jgi:hypothetical protein
MPERTLPYLAETVGGKCERERKGLCLTPWNACHGGDQTFVVGASNFPVPRAVFPCSAGIYREKARFRAGSESKYRSLSIIYRPVSLIGKQGNNSPEQGIKSVKQGNIWETLYRDD